MESSSSMAETSPLLTPSRTRTNRSANVRRESVDSYVAGSTQRANSLRRLQSVQTTLRTLQLDHTKSSWSIVSYVVAFLLLVIVPIFKLLFVKAATDVPNQLVFQPVVAFVEVSRSVVSFVFLSQAFRTHGLQGFLFLDAVAEEVAQIRINYDTVVELGGRRLIQLFVPSLILYLAESIWLYRTVDLQPMPFTTDRPRLDLGIVLVMTTLSWIFQTTTYLYACVLFWNVCKLQELKMRHYYEMLNQGLETEYYVLEYERIKRDLKDTSHRFRAFLAFTGVISVSAALVSMYEVVDSFNDRLSLCLWGDLVVLSVVNLTGAWQCLRSASKIAHLHRRIGRRAACVHARLTVASPLTTLSAQVPRASTMVQSSPQSKTPDDAAINHLVLEKLENYCQKQDAWARRAAIVEFLSAGAVGISVYGFILDRFFVHTSIGALLTTTWFILGRSLQG